MIFDVRPNVRRTLFFILLFLQVVGYAVYWLVDNFGFDSAYEFKALLIYPFDIYILWQSLRYVIPGLYYLKLSNSGLVFRNNFQKTILSWDEIEKTECPMQGLVKLTYKKDSQSRVLEIDTGFLNIKYWELQKILTDEKHRYSLSEQ